MRKVRDSYAVCLQHKFTIKITRNRIYDIIPTFHIFHWDTSYLMHAKAATIKTHKYWIKFPQPCIDLNIRTLNSVRVNPRYTLSSSWHRCRPFWMTVTAVTFIHGALSWQRRALHVWRSPNNCYAIDDHGGSLAHTAPWHWLFPASYRAICRSHYEHTVTYPATHTTVPEMVISTG